MACDRRGGRALTGSPPTFGPQILASHPRASVFVAANAGSGKTSTLVTRVARLLLDGAPPEAILCVTYTKAGAAEMQRRLFRKLGDWAVMEGAALEQALAEIDEAGRDPRRARRLFARALETPGGLKIQTIHAFCEKLLRRFPLEAGVSPGFTVLEDAAARAVSARARERVAELAMADPDGPVGAAYAHFSVALGWDAFNALFAAFETRRAAIVAHFADCEYKGGYRRVAWSQCGFDAPSSVAELEAEAVAEIRWNRWERAAEALLRGTPKTDAPRGEAMKAMGPGSPWSDIAAIFLTQTGQPRDRMATKAVDPAAAAWLVEEQARQVRNRDRLLAAAVAEETVHALTLARAYAGLYEGEKESRGALDFGDLVARSLALLTERSDAVWVLYKLDGGLSHILLDEAQDTAPEQWEILHALTGEFFTGLGAVSGPRTLFAVGDEKQSIFSFQGAKPEKLAQETQAFDRAAYATGAAFANVELLESYRSAPEILAFVDAVFQAPAALAGVRPGAAQENVVPFTLKHTAWRPAFGCVELWPLEASDPPTEQDVWAPVDSEGGRAAPRKLAARLAREVVAMVARGEAVIDRETGKPRACRYGDFLILVRRRNALFHEIIRALKREGAAVGGADRLKLTEHGAFADLMALGRFARFPGDDLNLAAVLRGPFCGVGEETLFALAHGREGSLWRSLTAHAAEDPALRADVVFLAWARGRAGATAPFDFYNQALGRLDTDGRSMRQRLLTRLGAEAEEAVDAFLAQALAAEGRDVRDLESFLAAMSESELEVKREADEGSGPAGGEVRVMTVHGAKGLEAPIVILPDTSSRATPQAGPLMETADDGFVWAPRKEADCPWSAQARARRETAVDLESARLLYVALTRARDRLIVAGVATKPQFYERSWRDYVEQAFDRLPNRAFTLEDGAEGRRYGLDPMIAPIESAPAAAAGHPLPAWAQGLAPAEAALAWTSPTGAGADESETADAPSPLAQVRGLGRYRRGDLIHRLLQVLPDLPLAGRAQAARAMLARERDLDDGQRAEMAAAALAVLDDPAFAAVFGPGSRAEVALAGIVDGVPVSGRVDRLLVEADRVLVIDFKTNRPAPTRIEDADPAYRRQMALYVALLQGVFPGRRVEAALLWTDGPRLMAAG